jgi:hypothetical protein
MGSKPKPIEYEINENGCWVCTSHGRTSYGYPMCHPGNRHVYISHIMYEKYKGPIPDGMFVCHRCDNPPCINPDHLWLGTAKDNIRDCVQKKRNNIGEKNGLAKLTVKQVQEIRQASGLQREIAERFGVSQSLISMIKNRVWWKHVGV